MAADGVGGSGSGPLLDRVPPQDLQAEQATLGAMLMERQAIEELRGFLTPAMFYSAPHVALCQAIFRLHDAGCPVDTVTLQADLRDHETLELVGGVTYLSQLEGAAPTAAGVSHYAAIVRDRYARRRAIEASMRLEVFARAATEGSSNGFVTKAYAILEEALPDADHGLHPVTMAELLEDPDAVEWAVQGILPAAGLAVLAGEGGEGKGWLALSLGDAMSTGRPWLGHFKTRSGGGSCLYYDAERGRRFMAGRVKEILAGTGEDPADVSFLFATTLDLDALRLQIKRRRPVLVVVDSLTRLLPPGTSDTDNAAMTALLGSLRDLAEEFGCCVLVIHHFRKRAQFSDNRPVARVRGATAIVNTADVVLAIAKTRDGDIRVECVKSYWGGGAPPFLVEWQAGEIGGTSLVYGGEVEPEAANKQEQAREIILATLETDTLNSKALRDRVVAAGISDRTAQIVLRKLEEDDEIRSTRDGKHKLFGLPAPEQSQ